MIAVSPEQVRCNRCRRVLSDPDWAAVGLGRVCAERLGLQRKRAPRLRRPARRDNPQQPDLLDLLDEINNEEQL